MTYGQEFKASAAIIGFTVIEDNGVNVQMTRDVNYGCGGFG